MKNIENNKLFKDIGIILLYNNNHIERIFVDKSKNKKIKMITINTLKEEIENFTSKSFDYFIQKGLSQKYDQNNTIALILKNPYKQDILKYHCFNNSNLEMKNDIPFYHEGIPEGFSMFCTRLEYMQIMAHIKKCEKKKNIIEKEQVLETEPIPNKRHFICQICKIKFDNYIEHINSKIHEENKLKFRNVFLRMKLTFRRIVNFKEIQKNNISNESTNIEVIELKDSESEQKENNVSAINSIIINNVPIKEESNLLINDENKENKENNNNNKSEYNCEDNNNKNSDKKDEDISVKDILNILDSIDSKNKYKLWNLKKRKKNEKNKYIFHDNYIFDLQKMTGRISYINTMNKMNN